jgi:hypothetical protein
VATSEQKNGSGTLAYAQGGTCHQCLGSRWGALEEQGEAGSGSGAASADRVLLPKKAHAAQKNPKTHKLAESGPIKAKQKKKRMNSLA